MSASVIIQIFSAGFLLPGLAEAHQEHITYWHSIAVKSDGRLWAWGRNNYGQVGDGTTTDSLSPVQIGSDNKWVMVSAGVYHSLGVKSDGTLWAWGGNEYGQLGLGHDNDRHEPTFITFSMAMPWLYLLLLQ